MEGKSNERGGRTKKPNKILIEEKHMCICFRIGDTLFFYPCPKVPLAKHLGKKEYYGKTGTHTQTQTENREPISKLENANIDNTFLGIDHI